METPARPETRERHAVPLYRAEIAPQRSASMRNINTAIILFALAALPFCTMFTVMGAWPVAIFVGLDVVLLAAGLRLHFWLGRSREVITITRDVFTVERIGATGRKRAWSASPHWLRIELTEIDDERIRLEVRERDNRTEVGRFLGTGEKIDLAEELSDRLRRLKMWNYSPNTSFIS